MQSKLEWWSIGLAATYSAAVSWKAIGSATAISETYVGGNGEAVLFFLFFFLCAERGKGGGVREREWQGLSLNSCIPALGTGQLTADVDDEVFLPVKLLRQHGTQAHLWGVCQYQEGACSPDTVPRSAPDDTFCCGLQPHLPELQPLVGRLNMWSTVLNCFRSAINVRLFIRSQGKEPAMFIPKFANWVAFSTIQSYHISTDN